MLLPVKNTWHTPPTGVTRDVKVGDVVFFYCNGKGRGGHHKVHARVTKVNTKTLQATELERSYKEGTLWTIYHTSECLTIVEQH